MRIRAFYVISFRRSPSQSLELCHLSKDGLAEKKAYQYVTKLLCWQSETICVPETAVVEDIFVDCDGRLVATTQTGTIKRAHLPHLELSDEEKIQIKTMLRLEKNEKASIKIMYIVETSETFEATESSNESTQQMSPMENIEIMLRSHIA